jgi:hypothetical protein
VTRRTSTAWRVDHHGRLAQHDLDSLHLRFEAAVPEVTTPRGKVLQGGRPVSCWMSGAIGGVRVVTDPARLRIEADRLLAAADILERHQDEHRRTESGQLTLSIGAT